MTSLSVGTVGSPFLVSGPIDERLKLLGLIEQSTIDHLFIADHVSFHTGLGMDGIVNAATLAAMSQKYRVYIGVYLLALRHPVPVARSLASLAASAPGRIVLGVGLGGEDPHELAICGVDRKTRGDRTNESLVALRKLLHGEPATHRCDYFDFQDALILPRPEPAIPLVIGGRSDAAIRRAGRLGDGWLGLWCSPGRYANVLQQIDDHAAEADRQPDWQHGLQLWVGVGDDRAAARDYVAAGMQDMYQIPFENFEKYTPYGTPVEVAEFLAPYVEAGARYLNLTPRGRSWEACIAHVHEVARLLKREFPELAAGATA